MVGLISFVLWLVASWFTIAANKDVFSPSKFFLLTLFLFFADIFFSPYDYKIYLTYFAFLLIGILVGLLEAFSRGKNYYLSGIKWSFISSGRLRWITALLWLTSVVPILAQFHLIDLFGGLEGYINSIGFRVVHFRGLGHITTVIKTIGPLNIIYFGVGLVANKKLTLRWWACYGFHLLVVILFAILSASRGSLLNHILILLVMYHYLHRTISYRTVAVLATSLISIGILLGPLREVKLRQGVVQTGFDKPASVTVNDVHELHEIKYGLSPLRLVYSKEPTSLEYGITFLTAITNFVPRKWWPHKPDTGGVVLTKDYTGDAWRGAAYKSPGIIAESIINFGYLFGCFFGFTVLLVALFFTVRMYLKTVYLTKKLRSLRVMVRLVSYIYIMMAVSRLTVSEFTNCFMGLVTNLVILWGFYWLVLRRHSIQPFRSSNIRLVFQRNCKMPP